MPGSSTIAGAQRVLDAYTGRVALAARTMYIAALTAAPTRTTTLATMVEVTAAGYARQTYVPTAPTSADPPVTGLSTQITYGPFSADPPSVGWLALVSASSGTTGDLVYYWQLDVPKDVGVGDSISAGSGTASISGVS